MNLQAAYGLLAHSLIFGAFFALLPLARMRPRVGLAATTLALLVGIAPMMHGTFGPPSPTLLLLAMLQLAGRTPSPFSWRPALGLLAFAALFYPMALGWGEFDPHAAGYRPFALLLASLPLAGLLWWRRRNVWLFILAIDLGAYAAGLFANLWDALFDPLLVLLALAVVIRQAVLYFSASRIR